MSDDARFEVDRLPCGTEVAELVDAVMGEAPTPDHAADCDWCQQWMTDFERRWRTVRAEAATDIPLPPGLLASIRDRIRAEVKFLRSAVEGEYDDGALHVAGHVLLTFIRGAVGREEEVFALSADVDTAGDITVEVAVEYGTPIAVIAEIVRQRAIEEYRRALGRAPQRVDVHIADLLDDSAD